MIDAHISTRDGMARLSDEARGLRPDQVVRYRAPQNDGDSYRWPAWKSVLFVVGFCAAFWTGVAFLASRLFG